MVIMWFVAFILTIVVLASSAEIFQTEGLRGGPANVHTQRVQVFLTLYEMLVIGGIAVKGHVMVWKEGPDPEGWRNL